MNEMDFLSNVPSLESMTTKYFYLALQVLIDL